MEIKFFTTLGCHLCEEALFMLKSLELNDSIVEEIEISDSDQLMERYGIRIPVLAIKDQELGWPFSVDELKNFIQSTQN